MGNLPALTNSLTNLQQHYVQLRIGNKSIKDMEHNVVKKEIAAILTVASFDMGSPMADNEKVLQFQTEACFGEIKGKYATLTIPELKESFRRGIRGEAGQFFGLCPKTYHQFIKWYFDLPERQSSWVTFLNSSVPTSEKPVMYTEDFYKRAAIDAFESYKKSGNLPSAGPAAGMYDCIARVLKLKTLINQNEWKEVLEIGKQNYTERMTPKKFYPSGKVKSVGTVVLDYSLENATLKFEVKKEGLKRYFDRLIKENKTLEL